MAGCHTLLQDFCAFRAFCERIPFALLVQQRLLHPLNICVDPCHLWEVISIMWVRGYGRMPYPPTRLLCWSVPSVGGYVCFVGAAETAAPPEIAFAVWLDYVRRLIELRSPSDWIAFAVWLDCVRRLIGLRPPSDWIAFAVRWFFLMIKFVNVRLLWESLCIFVRYMYFVTNNN